MSILGFTGTRHGMSAAAFHALRLRLQKNRDRFTHVHHGDCIGADEQFHYLARAQGWHITTHPGDLPELRAHAEFPDHTMEPRPCLERNRVIVQACEVLVAAPKTMREQPRSGTWATIAEARILGRPTFLVWPDGTITQDAPATRTHEGP